MNTSTRNVTRRTILTALFIALAIVVRNMSYMVYFLGAPGMRITIAPIFTRMPAMIFGPLYGGLASGVVDFISYLIKPEGPYIPLLTLTAVLDGVVTGLVWNRLKGYDTKNIKKVLWILFSIIGFIGVFNYINTVYYPQWVISRIINSMGDKKGFAVLGLVAVSAVGLILLTLDVVINKKFPQASIHKYYIKVLLAFGVAGIMSSVINTFFLKLFIPQLANVAFVAFLITRLVKEVFLIVILSYITSFLLSIYDTAVKSNKR